MPAAAARTLIDLCRASAERTPEAIALQFGADQFSYGELLAAGEAFASRLASVGTGPGAFAALLLENSLEYVVALLGIAAAGATAVPLNPETTRGGLEAILSDCGARTLITRSRILDRLGAQDIDVPSKIALSHSFAENRPWFTAPRAASASPESDSLAMVLYTSGTTGRPKGVMLTHGNLVANTFSIVEFLELSARDSIINVLPFFHSFGNSVLLTHLAVGAKVIIENRFAFPAQVVQTMQAARPTGFAGVPTTFYILLHKTNFLRQDWSFLRYICQAGGAMRVETVRQLRESLPRTAVYIMYGQTEASARLSWLPPDMLEKKLGSVGRAIPGVELLVANEAGEPVHGDETGEILARGPNIMRGYLNDAEGTAEVLRNGWLRTGDMARMDAEGFIYIVSRKSDFIKCASFRISPGEIEEAIAAAAPEVEDVAVIGVPDELLGEAVAACICCPADRFDAERIRKLCMSRLPLHKTPKYVVHEPQIPRTASGKKKYAVLREKYRNLGGTNV